MNSLSSCRAVEGKMQRNCFCFTVDSNYLFPATLSALQIREKTPQACADVVIICFGPATEQTNLCSIFCGRRNIKMLVVPQNELCGAPLAYARLFVDQVLPSQYENIVYLDGDTQVLSNLEDFFVSDIESYAVLAARDAMTLIVGGDSTEARKIQRYFSFIGLQQINFEDYFNSGIMKFNRNAIGAIRHDVLHLYRRRGPEFKFFDQDALNIVLARNVNFISMKWNFPAFLMRYSHFRDVQANVIHFCSNPRPWHGPYWPWGKQYHRPYIDFAREFPNLNERLQPFTGLKYWRYVLQTRYKSLVEPFIWDTDFARDRRALFERNVVI